MNVYDNIAFGLKMRGMNKQEIKNKVYSAAKSLGLENLLSRKPKELSGGQRQRVALGRAIVRNPKVFLMDEPLSNLDANLRTQMRTEIKRLHKELGTTFIYVTHDQTEALTMGDRIVVLDKGKIQQIASPLEIYNNPKNKFVAGFVGQMNFIEVPVVNNKIILEGSEIELPFISQNSEVIIGIRAENMQTGAISINTNVDFVEILGAEKNVYFKINGVTCVSKVSLDYVLTNSINIKLDVNNMFFFDKSTGANLQYNQEYKL